MDHKSVQRITLSEPVEASLVIPHFYPSRKKNLDFLIDQLRQQTFTHVEVLVVHQVSPQGKAINLGARAARGDILLVMDDDAYLDKPDVIEALIRVIRENPEVGMAGASIISPDNINAFQRAAAKQFPRFHMPVVEQLTDSDLPCHGCVAFPMKIFKEVGMERETILRGLDPDLRVRIRKAGYRVVLVPRVWIYHPFPESVRKFMRLFFRNGYGSAYTQIFHPEMSYDTDEKTDSSKFVAKRPFLYRIMRFPLRLLRSIITLQWIRFLGYFVYIFGYAYGYLKHAFGRNQSH